MDDLVSDFVVETREGIEALDSELVRFEQEPDNPLILDGVFRLIHTIKGTCGFIGLPRLQSIAHAAETLLGGFRDGSTPVTTDGVSAVLRAVDLIREIVDGLSRTGVEMEGDDRQLVELLEQACHAAPAEPVAAEPVAAEPAPAADRPLLERVGGEATLDAACELAIAKISVSPSITPSWLEIDPDRLQSLLRAELCSAARGFGGAESMANAVRGLIGADPEPQLSGLVLREIGVALNELDIAPETVSELVSLVDGASLAASEDAPPPIEEPTYEAAPKVREAPPPRPAATEGDANAVQTIRVSVDALEHLMTVASELVLIRNQLLQLLRDDPESAFAAPLHRLNQVTSELQEGVMTTRMQPISGAWAKLPRLVRDLSSDLGKKIELSLEGQDTELDRQVLELIKDPLTHMVRNAADHGLEAPEARLAAGKSEVGRIKLSARHEGGAIVIEVCDDGRGLSASRIRAKAVESGVITPQQAEALSDADAKRLIFMAGFSTAAEVTSVSGRGVGMDVVRTNIEKIGGVIELSSTEGQGCQFTIRIPLTLTIISALIVECCGERFAMPQSSVIELVSASESSAHKIEYIDGAAVLRLRDRLLPLVSLQSLLDLPAEDARAGETCIVVAKVGSFTYGLIVDRVFDTEEIVVKPTSSVLRHLRIYSGATILGDGSVIMILDFKGMSRDLGEIANGAMLEDEAAAGSTGLEPTSTLIFKVAGGAIKAAPLGAVARIEEIDAAQVEHVDGRSVIQYRGKLMPVVEANGRFLEAGAETQIYPLLVFARGERAVGLMVEEIIDVMDIVIEAQLRSSGNGSAGSLIIAGKATELIDVDFYWRQATGDAAASEASTPLSTPTPRAVVPIEPPPKRLLVIDRSPFSQLLLQPLLSKAGYEVIVANDPDTVARMHASGESFDLIMADTGADGAGYRPMAEVLMRANAWHSIPLLGLAVPAEDSTRYDVGSLLSTVAKTLSSPAAAERVAA